MYVSLAVGENDDTLVWPFLGNVIITLVSKESPKSSISHSFPTANNNSFPNPKTCYGFLQFLSEREVLSLKFSGGFEL